ncbi:hypothetical protein KCG43_12425 [Photobacterium sp. WH24]|uniref:hypothetical protein n=1 Tax=Photobacterium sp. WH24 TaxID=2827237 RepID=UPI001C45F746|nr:hypothetical protein [Photobacterium sp. WH24]MBV7262802.1 hypothetical protein [Photobacterium sp. WH24]
MSIQPIHHLLVKDTTAGVSQVTQITPGLHEQCAFNPLGWYDITFPENKGETTFAASVWQKMSVLPKVSITAMNHFYQESNITATPH